MKFFPWKSIGLALGVACALAAQQSAQPPPPTVKFEVASVRPVENTRDGNPSFSAYRAGKVSSFCIVCISGLHYDNYGMPLKALISNAYRIDARLLVAPDWINQDQDRFAIHAEIPEGSTRDQIPDMLRALLDERFHLVVHRATVEQAGYALVTGKNGPKLKEPSSINPEACDGWHPIPAEKTPAIRCVRKYRKMATAPYGSRCWQTPRTGQRCRRYRGVSLLSRTANSSGSRCRNWSRP